MNKKDVEFIEKLLFDELKQCLLARYNGWGFNEEFRVVKRYPFSSPWTEKYKEILKKNNDQIRSVIKTIRHWRAFVNEKRR